MKSIEKLADQGELFTNLESETIQTQFYEQIVDAAKRERVGRQLVDVVKLRKGSTLRFVLEDKNSLGFREIGEGTEIPADVESYSKIEVSPTKYGNRIPISSEMREDSKWNLLKRNLKRAGYKAGLKEDNIIFNTFSDEAGLTISSDGTELALSDIVEARRKVNQEDFSADTIVMNPKQVAELQLIDTFTEADKIGTTETIRNGFVGKIFGLNVIETPTISKDTVYVMDSKVAGVLVVKRPLTQKMYEVPERDSYEVALTFRKAAKVLRGDSIAKITVSA